MKPGWALAGPLGWQNLVKSSYNILHLTSLFPPRIVLKLIANNDPFEKCNDEIIKCQKL